MNGGLGDMDNEKTRLEPLEVAEATDAEMVAFEVELRRALRPVELPAGFADRVLARAGAGAETPQRAKVLAFPRWRVALSGAIAAALVAGSMVGVNVHQNRERARERAAATAQFEAASRITDQVLEHTREQLSRAGVFGQ